MSFIRGEEILHKKMRINGSIHNAIKILEKIGKDEEDILEFIDLTEKDVEAKKSFNPLIDRCNSILNKLITIENFANKLNIKSESFTSYFDFNTRLMQEQLKTKLPDSEYFDFIENEVKEQYNEISQLYLVFNQVKENLLIEIERKVAYEKYFSLTSSAVLDKKMRNARDSFRRSLQLSMSKNNFYNAANNNIDNNNNDINMNNYNSNQPGKDGQLVNESRLSLDSMIKENLLFQIVGVVKAEYELKMKRAIFRTGKDRVFTSFFDAEFPKDLGNEYRKVFIIICPLTEYLQKKVIQICDLYECSRFDLPEDYAGKTEEILTELQNKILEQKVYLEETKTTLKTRITEKLIEDKLLQLYKIYFTKRKLVFLNLSKCIVRENFIDGEVWIIKDRYHEIKTQLEIGEDENTTATFIDIKDYGMNKPTYIRTNKFTYPFQEIVNQYGLPRYKEFNPGYFTIVTFPFLFGIMFGDIGHGIILLLLTFYLFNLYKKNKEEIRNNNDLQLAKNKDNEILNFCLDFRYFFLLCSISSIFCGFMYNEFFSMSLNLFGSCYTNKNGKYLEKGDQECVYIFGVDPGWTKKVNSLTYTNSLKMKISIIVGVIQMTLGVLLKGINELYFKKYISFFFEFIPQLMFMFLFLGYLVFMIFYKWTVNWGNNDENAPSILSLLMNIVLKGGSVDNKPLFDEKLFGIAQEKLNKIILYSCIILIPFMLFVKPILIFMVKYRKRGIHYHKDSDLVKNELVQNNLSSVNLNSENDYSLSQESEVNPEAQYSQFYDENRHKYKIESKQNFEFTNLFINQLISTIEFILGSVSNTASYLRLWALSLAHCSLSDVFIDKIVFYVIDYGNDNAFIGIFKIFISFFVFMNFTAFILLFMDAMECILHTLRLHWVEFQNKFYKGDGYYFKPFTFKNLMDN